MGELRLHHVERVVGQRLLQLVHGSRDDLAEEPEPRLDRRLEGAVELGRVTGRLAQEVAGGDVGADLGGPQVGGKVAQLGHRQRRAADVHGAQEVDPHELSMRVVGGDAGMRIAPEALG